MRDSEDNRSFQFDVLMANPPFAGDIKETRMLAKYALGKKPDGKYQKAVGRDILFIERNLDFLKPGANPGKDKILPNHVLKTDGTIHFYTDPIHAADEMEILCLWINENIESRHPLIVASIAHYNMVRIHPFDDGNGRGARILMNLILIKKGYPPAIIKNKNRRKYLEALNQADKGDIYPFLRLMADAMIETENTVIEQFHLLKDRDSIQKQF